MGIFTRFFNRKSEAIAKYQLVTERGNGTYAYDGKLYNSDIVRACIAPYQKAVGKLSPKHIRSSPDGVKVNPEPYMRVLLEDPNPILSMQKLLEKMLPQRILSGNAFALIIRDANGYPVEIFPLAATSVEAVYKNSELYLKFWLENGKCCEYNYDDIIHIRGDCYGNDVFGEPLMSVLSPLMDIVNTIDKGIIKAIKNSNVIKWLLKYAGAVRPEDLKRNAEEFAKSYLDTSNSTVGVAAVDGKADAVQVMPKDYVPNFAIMESVHQRIYSVFGISEKIVKGNYTEDEWTSFYESSIEPIAIDLQNEFTRKLFTKKERAFGNKIIFEASNLACASLTTKLNFVQMVDRGAMTPNEWREIFSLTPVEDGDKPIRRLDTATVSDGNEKGGEIDENKHQRNNSA